VTRAKRGALRQAVLSMRNRALACVLGAFFVVTACNKSDALQSGASGVISTASVVQSASAAAPLVEGAPGAAPSKRPREKFDEVEVDVPPAKSALHVAWRMPDGTGVNDDAPFGVRWVSSDGLATTPTDISAKGKDVAKGFDVPIELMAGSTGGKLAGDLDMVICDTATHSVCVPLKRRLEITLRSSAGVKPGAVELPLPAAK